MLQSALTPLVRNIAHVAEPRRQYSVQPSAADEALRDTLRELRLVMAVLTVSIGALRRQDADCDSEIAEVLERCASDRLDIEIEKLQARVST